MLNVLKKNLVKTARKYRAKGSTGIACTEPCKFPRCMNGCLHEDGEVHMEHICSIHNYTVKEMSQQVTLPTSSSSRLQEHVGSAAQEVIDTESEDDADRGMDFAEAEEPDLDTEREQEQERVMRQKQNEEKTGHLDFDYPVEFETYLVKPSGQLRNRVKAFVNTTWSILSEEVLANGQLPGYPVQNCASKVPQPDPQQVWWTEVSSGDTSMVTPKSVRTLVLYALAEF